MRPVRMPAATRALLKISLGPRVQLENCSSPVSLALEPFSLVHFRASFEKHLSSFYSTSVHTCTKQLFPHGACSEMVQRVRNRAARREQIRCCHYGHNVGLIWHLPSLAEVLRSLCVSSWRDLVLFSASSSFIDAPSSTWSLLSRISCFIHTIIWLALENQPNSYSPS